MKIALMMSGLPRDIEEAYPYIRKNILDKHDVDVFGYLWYGDEAWARCSKEKYHIGVSDSLKNYMDFLKYYSPISVTYTKQVLNDGDFQWYGPEEHPDCHRASMFFGWEQCLKMVKSYEKRSGTSYDLYGRWRTGLCPQEEIHFEDFLDDKLHVSLGPVCNGYKDHSAFATPKIFERSCEVYSAFKNDKNRYSLQTSWPAQYWTHIKTVLDPENTFRRYIDQMNIPVVKEWRLSSVLARELVWWEKQNGRPPAKWWLPKWKEDRGIKE